MQESFGCKKRINMKIYSGIEDADRNIPWIDDETGEEGADKAIANHVVGLHMVRI